MGRLSRRLVGAIVAGALPLAAHAQVPFNLDQSASTPTATSVGGTPSIDIITLRGMSPGAPLRFGNVIAGSETVQLGTRSLIPGQDYAVDYGTGVVYLKVAAKAGDVLTVSYRYDNKPDPNAAKQFAGIAGFKYSLVPGGLNMLMGLGMTERASDGTVLSSNMFGFDNSMHLGGGAVKGLFLFSQRQKNDVRSGLQMNPDDKPGTASADDGDSRLIVESLNTKAMGGNLSVDYQDISKNFAAFSGASDAGYDAATVSKLQKERGLTRFGYTLQDMKFGGLGFSNSFRNVQDDGGAIEWRNYGVNVGGLKLNYTSQRVDQGFTRFKDIAEGDRDQLAKEKGMDRQTFGGEWAQKFGKMAFEDNAIQDELTGKAIERRLVRLDTSKINFELGDQDVATGFNRFDSLMASEKAQWGLEAGLHRQWTNLQTSMFGSQTPLSYSQSIIKSSTGEYRAEDIAMKGKTWNLQHSVRSIDSGFGSLGAMQGNELNAALTSISSMYGPGVAPGGNDRNILLQNRGLSREYSSVQTELFKGWNASFSNLKLTGQQDGGIVDTASLAGKAFSMTYRHENLGKQFSEVTSLMAFEQQRLGTIAGLDRTDLGMNFALGGSKKLSINKLTASMSGAGLNRTSVGYTDKKIDVQVNTREVDPTMTAANQLVDPEKDILQALAGFSEHDATVKWQLLPTLKLNVLDYSATNQSTAEERMQRQIALDWSPNKSTQVSYVKSEQRNQNPLSELFASMMERISVTRDFGRYGKISYMDESQSLGGTTATSPGHHTEYLAYETKIDQKTSLKTEQTRTSYDNGDKEDISANTISTAVTKNAGVSVTDVSIDRNGEDRDEKKRNYGFWFDLGHGMRVSYGYARQLDGDQSTYNSTFAVGSNAGSQTADKVNTVQQGQLGNLLLGGGYGVNSWDASNRTQSFSNVSLSMAKPMNFGLLKNMKFGLSYDTAADYAAWLRENRDVAMSGSFLGNNFGYEYKSQMAGTGDRGIDRAFKFETPKNDKNWLQASINYKARTLPDSQNVAIRDYQLTVKPSRAFSLEQHLYTNREVAKGDALLGSITEADRTNLWSLNYQRSPNLTISASWKEAINDQSTALSRTGGLTFKFNEKKGSPLTLFYGLEQVDGNVARQTKNRYYLQYDQKPGANQMFSLFVGDISYAQSIPSGSLPDNITLRLDYQLKF